MILRFNLADYIDSVDYEGKHRILHTKLAGSYLTTSFAYFDSKCNELSVKGIAF